MPRRAPRGAEGGPPLGVLDRCALERSLEVGARHGARPDRQGSVKEGGSSLRHFQGRMPRDITFALDSPQRIQVSDDSRGLGAPQGCPMVMVVVASQGIQFPMLDEGAPQGLEPAA